jgi:hypothetical protein
MIFPITSVAISSGGYPGQEVTVNRRFKDFVALQDLLQVDKRHRSMALKEVTQ